MSEVEMSAAFERLGAVRFALEQQGVRDVKFTFAPGAVEALPASEVATKTAEFLESYAAGKGAAVCPHCLAPAASDWTPEQVRHGHRFDGGTKVYHCHMAAD